MANGPAVGGRGIGRFFGSGLCSEDRNRWGGFRKSTIAPLDLSGHGEESEARQSGGRGISEACSAAVRGISEAAARPVIVDQERVTENLTSPPATEAVRPHPQGRVSIAQFAMLKMPFEN